MKCNHNRLYKQSILRKRKQIDIYSKLDIKMETLMSEGKKLIEVWHEI